TWRGARFFEESAMKTNSRRMRRTAVRGGFTLLEVMLVVGLLALLAALIIPKLGETAEQAKKKITLSQLGPSSSLAQAIERYKMDIGKYPESLKDLMEKPADEATAAKWAGYLPPNTELKDPWGNPYQYLGGDAAKHNEKGFDLWSWGVDQIDG